MDSSSQPKEQETSANDKERTMTIVMLSLMLGISSLVIFLYLIYNRYFASRGKINKV